MINVISQTQFTKMPWKNGLGTTTQIKIFPPTARLENNDFLYRISSAPVDKNGDFSLFPKKLRILTPIKGAGFKLNSYTYEKFEIAQFSGDDKTHCELLKDAIVDFGVIYDSEKIKAHPRILNLKSDLSFALDPKSEYFVTVLSGTIEHEGHTLKELETLHYQNEDRCNIKVPKSAILFFLKLDAIA